MTDHLFLAVLCTFVPTMALGGLALWAVCSERFRQYRAAADRRAGGTQLSRRWRLSKVGFV